MFYSIEVRIYSTLFLKVWELSGLDFVLFMGQKEGWRGGGGIKRDESGKINGDSVWG